MRQKQEHNQQNNPYRRIDSQQHTEASQQQDDPGACNRLLGRWCPPRFRVLAHVVEILEVVETGHQPIPAKNDPSDQENDVHLDSFLSALLDDHALIAHNPVMLAQKQQDCGSQNCTPGRPTGPSISSSNPTVLPQRFAVRWVDEPNHLWQ